MPKLLLIVLLLTCGLGISGCATNSVRSPPVCPVIPELPANLRTPLNAEQNLRALLLESEPLATPSSEP